MGVHILNLGGDLWVCAWLCHQEAPATESVEGLEMNMMNEGDPLLMAVQGVVPGQQSPIYKAYEHQL